MRQNKVCYPIRVKFYSVTARTAKLYIILCSFSFYAYINSKQNIFLENKMFNRTLLQNNTSGNVQNLSTRQIAFLQYLLGPGSNVEEQINKLNDDQKETLHSSLNDVDARNGLADKLFCKETLVEALNAMQQEFKHGDYDDLPCSIM